MGTMSASLLAQLLACLSIKMGTLLDSLRLRLNIGSQPVGRDPFGVTNELSQGLHIRYAAYQILNYNSLH